MEKVKAIIEKEYLKTDVTAVRSFRDDDVLPAVECGYDNKPLLLCNRTGHKPLERGDVDLHALGARRAVVRSRLEQPTDEEGERCVLDNVEQFEQLAEELQYLMGRWYFEIRGFISMRCSRCQ